MRKRGVWGGKGQITAFIIIAIVLLFSAALFFYIRGKLVEYKPPIDSVQDTSLELHPVKSYVEECIYRVSREGIELMGMQGGWISTTDSSLSGETFFNFVDPTESDTLTFFSFNIPYWWYMKSKNRCTSLCTFDSKRPPLNSDFNNGASRPTSDTSMEAQLDRYVKENIEQCLAGFYSFEKAGITVTPKGDIVPTTFITDTGVDVYLDYPLEVVQAGTASKLGKFSTTLPVNLKEVYELAREITYASANYTFIDDIVMNVINLHAHVNGDLPPLATIDFSSEVPHFWMKSKVKSFIKDNILPTYLQAIQVVNTRNYKHMEAPEGAVLPEPMQGLLNSLEVNFLPRAYDVEVDFFYLGFPMYLDVNPSDGELIAPESVTSDLAGKILSTFMNRYQFFYDVTFPSVVLLNSPNAFNEEGFKFQFALESNIRYNKPFRPENIIFAGAEDTESEIFYNPNQRISGDITVETRNKLTGEPVPHVLVSYRCGPNSIVIGQTEIVEDKSILVSKFPVCVGGVASFMKEGFIETSIIVDTKIGEPGYILVE